MEQYADVQQLMKREDGQNRKPIYPPTVIQAVFDGKTGASLEAILAQFNSVYVQYQGTPEATRNIIPKEMRRAGLTITYMDMDSNTITERANSAVQKDNDHWALDVNWSRVDELSLSGDISVSAKGTWIINGTDTGVKAVGPKGDTGLTPWLKTIDNKLHFSYDNVTWEPCSENIAAWFRWSGNKIQISRDNKTWTDLSGKFADNVHIKGYVANYASLPSGAVQGDIYGVGPTYAAEDTARTNPIYRYYVRNANSWVDNGQFTSLSAGVVQETGDSETEVMSQKAVSEKLSELGSRVKIKDYLIQDEYYEPNGTIGVSNSYMRLPIIKASDKLAIIGFNSKMINNGGCRCFGSNGQYIGDVEFTNIQEKDYIYDLPSDTTSIGLYFKTSVDIPNSAFIESPVGAMTNLYIKSNEGLKGVNILQDSSLWRGGYINSQGSVGIGSGDINIYKYVLIPVKEGETFLYWYQGVRNDLNCFFNSDIVKVGDNIVMQKGLNRLVVPKDSSYLGLTIQFGASDSYLYKWLVKDNTPIASIAKEAIEGNIFKIVKISDYLVKGSLWNPGGSLSSINTFDRTALIPATKGFYYIGCKINNVRCFDGDKRWISDEAISNDEYLQYVTLSEDTAYVGINFKVENQPDILYTDANLVIDSNPLVKPIFDKPNNLSYNSSVLTKKKWYFAGDSFSAGIGLDKFVDGIFSGKPKIYPYLIALRNGMTDVVNDGISGSAMTYQEGDSRTNNAYSVSRYKNIPSDADYITLYFGINDDNYQSPLGTIDDEVNTTFYGAWNVVMKHIITNHPLAKIGIIITNGSAPKYTAAERAIAKKYGVSYLDMELDDKIPHFLRQAEKVAALGIPADIVNLRTQTYALNPPSDTHPNEKAHEFESTFIEAWLKTL